LSVARVVLDSPLPQLDRLLDYRIPPTLVEQVFEGSLVHVPLRSGGRQTLAYVVEISSASDYAGRLSDVSDVVSAVSVLPRRLYDLARTVADRQAGTVADVLRLALPRRYVRAEKLFAARSTETPVAVEPCEVVGVDQHAAPDARLAVTVRFTNESPEPLTLRGSSHKLTLNGRDLGSAVGGETVEVPALSSVSVELPLNLSNFTLLALARDLQRDPSALYEIQSTLYPTSRLGRPLRITKTGRLDLRALAAPR
jgi:primosomal protein N'